MKNKNPLGARELNQGVEVMPAIPTFPQGDPCSIIGVLRFNFRVRNGIGWDPGTIVTGKPVRKHEATEKGHV